GAAALAVLVALPAVLSSYQLSLVTKMLIFGIFAMSLDLLLGYAGLPSLGHAAYFGVAAYTVGLLALRVANNFWLDFPAGLLMAAGVSALFGLLALRTRGSYFLMITLALSQVLWGIAFGWRSLTGGDDGLPEIPRPDLGLPWSMSDNTPFYYFVLFFFLVGAFVLVRVVASPFGYALGDRARHHLRARRAACSERSRRPHCQPAQGANRSVSALVVEALSRNFGGVRALSNVSLAIEPGERRLIIGPNGAGKTTLFNIL